MIDLDALLAANDGILLARFQRSRKSSLSRWCRAGRLTRLLPGVYVHPRSGGELAVRLRAVVARIPEAVFAGSVAARLTAWPNEPVAEVTVFTSGRRVSSPGFRMVRRRVPPELVHRLGPLAVVAPAWLALDAAAADRGERIDHLLRLRHPLSRIEAALAACPGRPGNQTRRRVLRRSRSLPWSQAERLFHEILDRHRITGWKANQPVRVGNSEYLPDAAFKAARVACEVDGFEHHSSRAAFHSDRRRQNALILAGWTVLRFTWEMLADEADVVDAVRTAVRLRPRARSGHQAG